MQSDHGSPEYSRRITPYYERDGISIKNRLINLHCFFDRITEWGFPDPPQRPLIFAGDLPIVDKPLPRSSTTPRPPSSCAPRALTPTHWLG